MATLQGTVVDDKDAPIQSATVTLIGAAAPRVQATDAQGKFSFPDLPPGNYKLSAVSEGRDSVLLSDVVVTADQNPDTKITINSTAISPARKPAVLAQNLALSVIAILCAVFLFGGLFGIDATNLKDDLVARGVITYLVSVGTVTIAIVLVLSVILGNGGQDLKDRFSFGKEVLSVLIGVLGTIIGFYYGSTIKTEAKDQPAGIQMATVKITPDRPVAGTSVNFSTLVTGGEQPYTYSIKFDTDVLPAIVNQPSSDGKISQDISIPSLPANTSTVDIGFQIEVKDKKGAVFTYNKNGQQKLTLQAAATPTK